MFALMIVLWVDANEEHTFRPLSIVVYDTFHTIIEYNYRQLGEASSFKAYEIIAEEPHAWGCFDTSKVSILLI